MFIRLTSILVELSGFGSVSTTSVAGTLVGDGFVAVADGAAVGGGSVGAGAVAPVVGGTAVGGEPGVGADPQATTKTIAKISTTI